MVNRLQDRSDVHQNQREFFTPGFIFSNVQQKQDHTIDHIYLRHSVYFILKIITSSCTKSLWHLILVREPLRAFKGVC